MENALHYVIRCLYVRGGLGEIYAAHDVTRE